MSGLETGFLLGGVHSVVLAVVLSSRTRNRRANRYLSALLAALAVLLFDGFMRARGTLAAHPHLIGLAAWVPFVVAPLIFLYVRTMTAPDPVRASWRHFLVPAAYVAVLVTTFVPRSADYKLRASEHGIVQVIEIALLVYGIAYAIAALVLLRRHRAHVQALYSNLRGVSLRWLLVLAALNVLVWISALVAFVVRVSGITDSQSSSVIVPIGSTVTVFVIGYFQLGQAEIFVPAPVVATPASSAAVDAKSPSAYQRARLADDDAATLEARIKTAMTEKKLYQRAGLTLAELADEVGATPHEVSQVLSTRLQRNFYTFINEHRVEHVKAGLTAGERPVLDLAFEAGFQSKSTFNSAFRKATGMTPREFRARATS